jgi:hypothetical protein
VPGGEDALITIAGGLEHVDEDDPRIVPPQP